MDFWLPSGNRCHRTWAARFFSRANKMGKLFIDYTGRRFGRLLVISEFKEGKYRWCVCQCDCGKKPTVRKNSLPYGTTQSCGCLSVDTSRTHGKSASLAYASWKAMKERCYRTYHPAYRHYGGRGITVCDKWKDSFEAFFRSARSSL